MFLTKTIYFVFLVTLLHKNINQVSAEDRFKKSFVSAFTSSIGVFVGETVTLTCEMHSDFNITENQEIIVLYNLFYADTFKYNITS